MILVILFTALWAIPLLIALISNDELWAYVALVFFFVFLLAVPFGIPMQHSIDKADMQGFESIRSTVETARVNGDISILESAAMQMKIIEANAWLASSKYWVNHPLVNWYRCKDILKLLPIK